MIVEVLAKVSGKRNMRVEVLAKVSGSAISSLTKVKKLADERLKN
jgi:hypothetical protein